MTTTANDFDGNEMRDNLYQQAERQKIWRVAYEKCISSDAETCISEADKAVAAYDKMVEAMKERFG